MPSHEKIEIKARLAGEVKPEVKPFTSSPGESPPQIITFGARLNDVVRRPRRNPIIHWAALILSIISLIPLIIWVANPLPALSSRWYGLDIWFSVFFAVEFFTRSGFRWDPGKYIWSHLFDFIAIVPALVLVHYSVPYQSVWVWIILVARVIRALDRVLGDGFITRNVLAVADGFEEEITDRVMVRIMDRIQADLDRGKFGEAIGKVFERNKAPVLEKIRSQHPRIIETGLAHLVGIDSAVERSEERIYDAVVNILESAEIDKAIREAVDSTFSTTRKEIAARSWRKNLGFRRYVAESAKPKTP